MLGLCASLRKFMHYFWVGKYIWIKKHFKASLPLLVEAHLHHGVIGFLSAHLNPPSSTEKLAEPRAFPNHTWSWGRVHLLMSFFPSPFGFRELRFNFTKPILQAWCHTMAGCASAY